MEHAKDPITMHGVHRLLPEADDPITTGSIGKTQGVSTVKTPAMNATIKNAMKPRGRDLLDLLRKDYSATIPRFRRRGDFAGAKYASRLDYENLYAVGLFHQLTQRPEDSTEKRRKRQRA